MILSDFIIQVYNFISVPTRHTESIQRPNILYIFLGKMTSHSLNIEDLVQRPLYLSAFSVSDKKKMLCNDLTRSKKNTKLKLVMHISRVLT
jgi:hypothetical protein